MPSRISSLLIALAFLALTSTAQALTVSNTNDSGTGSLRAAVAGTPLGGTIDFAIGLDGATINLSSAIAVDDRNIDATSLPSGITISGAGSSRIFQCSGTGTSTFKKLTLRDGVISGAADLRGGAVDVISGSTTFENCTFTANRALGLRDGGAIGFFGNNLTIRNCTFHNNGETGRHGGAIFVLSSSACTIENSTFYQNNCQGYGAAIHIASGVSASIRHCTITENDTLTNCGGIYNRGTLTLENTIVAENMALDINPDIDGAITTTIGVNFVGDTTGATGLGTLGTDYLTTANNGPINLDPLANNGGITKTLHPLPGSPAIDMGGTTTLSTDQRGAARALDGDSDTIITPDIGAVEKVGPLVANLNDAGTGSLRDAVSFLAPSGTITFDPGLSGSTINLSSELTVDRTLTIDASALGEQITLDAGGSTRLFHITADGVTLDSLQLTAGNAPDGQTFPGDAGGAILVEDADALVIRNCSLTGNSARFGGAIAINNSGTQPTPPLFDNCTFSENLATGGASARGGAAYLANSAPEFRNCTLAGNAATSGNAAFTTGGGIHLGSGDLTINHCTLSDNDSDGGGGGIYNNGSTLNLINSIVAGNTAPSDPNIFGTPTQTGLNIISGDPLLAPLGDYGGPTQTMPPLPGSPAIDMAGSSVITTDQRGILRPQGISPDIGAVEYLPRGFITVDASHTWDSDFDPTTFDASGSDKLVVVATGEHHFSGTLTGSVNSITYNGQALTQAVVEPTGGLSVGSTSSIWYLDAPGTFTGPGTIDVSHVGNNFVFTALRLSNTLPGHGAVAASDGTYSVDLTTTTADSIVIAAVGLGGDGNTATITDIDADYPLNEASALEIGNDWAGHVTGYAQVPIAGPRTYSFTDPSSPGTDVATIAVEFQENILVNTVIDENDGIEAGGISLRDAINRQINSNVPKVIRFDPAISGQTITLTNGQLTINKDVTLDASALSEGITIHANNLSRVMEITSGHTVALHNLALSNGEASGANGGGIYSSRLQLQLVSCLLPPD